MYKKRLLILVISVLLMCLIIGSKGLKAKVPPSSPVSGDIYIHTMAPSFSLKSLSGKTYNLEMTKGKPTVINFWASWCGPCNMEAPELSQLYDQYKGAFNLYAVNLTDTEWSIKAVKAFKARYQFAFPVLLDTDGNVSELYHIRPVPTTVFLNSKGEIVDQVLGYGGEGVLEAKLQKLLKGETDPN
ncbi:TlpA disulfide reductase family protein [Pullulanibacillus sp. KACC 23026]|uniref:TlpA family protein disulfide reductase n=1 Tax=Pullulanibacillus sp. KACC 23026 TaxID=3028315 RepID=UPI0023B0845D|nr:TlpA disulfide reductase family protein [Pullulanibacillus sp. KACC 23026]WEG12914.1 TlpA disulfide reductase family protein [Pullulanibacillus sp. KACC 23026]